MAMSKMTQSEIDALLRDSDMDESASGYKDSLGESGVEKSRVVGGFQHYGQESESHH